MSKQFFLLKKVLPSGGKRKGAGRRPKFDEPTTRAFVIVPVSKKEDFYAMAAKWLKKFESKKKK